MHRVKSAKEVQAKLPHLIEETKKDEMEFDDREVLEDLDDRHVRLYDGDYPNEEEEAGVPEEILDDIKSFDAEWPDPTDF